MGDKKTNKAENFTICLKNDLLIGAVGWFGRGGWKWLLLFGVYWGLVFGFFLTSPPPWPDEALFADVAKTWRETGYWGTEMWEGLVVGVDKHFLQYPPGLFGLIALSQVWFGVSVWGQRLVSVVWGSVVLGGGVRLIRKFWRREAGNLAWWVGLLLGTDFIFLYLSRLSRPEMMVLGCLVLALNILWQRKQSLKSVVVAGLMSGVGSLAHPIALLLIPIGLVSVYVMANKRVRVVQCLWFAGASSVPVLLWLVSNWRNWRLIGLYFHLAAITKMTFDYWVWFAAWMMDRWLVVSLSVMQGVVLWLVIRGMKGKNTGKEKVVVWWAVMAWAVAIMGKTLWYRVFPVFFTYLAIAYLAKNSKKIGKWIVVGLLGVNLTHLGYELIQVDKFKPNYDDLVRQVEEIIPEGSSVFLSSRPDVYFGLVKAEKEYRMIEFPALPLDPGRYGDVLDSVDYAVFGGENSGNLTGNYVELYLKKNMVGSTSVVSSPYKLEVVKLKPRLDREKVQVPGGRFGSLPLASEIESKWLKDK